MAKTKTSKKTVRRSRAEELDGVFFLKMVLYLLIGSLWLKIDNGIDIFIPIPIGLLIGLIFTTHEHFRIDKKIEYVVLLLAMLIGYWAPFGLYVDF